MKVKTITFIGVVSMLCNMTWSHSIRKLEKQDDFMLDISRANDLCKLYPDLISCQLARDDPEMLRSFSRKFNLAPLPEVTHDSSDAIRSDVNGSWWESARKRPKRAMPDNPCSHPVATIVLLTHATDSLTGANVELVQAAPYGYQYFAYFTCLMSSFKGNPCIPQTREFFAIVYIGGVPQYRQIGFPATCAITVPA